MLRVAIGPSHRCIRLVILCDGLTQYDSSRLKRGLDLRGIANAELDLNLTLADYPTTSD